MYFARTILCGLRPLSARFGHLLCGRLRRAKIFCNGLEHRCSMVAQLFVAHGKCRGFDCAREAFPFLKDCF